MLLPEMQKPSDHAATYAATHERELVWQNVRLASGRPRSESPCWHESSLGDHGPVAPFQPNLPHGILMKIKAEESRMKCGI